MAFGDATRQETIMTDVGARGVADLLRMHIAKFVQLASLTRCYAHP
jgi:hypothetical protein